MLLDILPTTPPGVLIATCGLFIIFVAWLTIFRRAPDKKTNMSAAYRDLVRDISLCPTTTQLSFILDRCDEFKALYNKNNGVDELYLDLLTQADMKRDRLLDRPKRFSVNHY